MSDLFFRCSPMTILRASRIILELMMMLSMSSCVSQDYEKLNGIESMDINYVDTKFVLSSFFDDKADIYIGKISGDSTYKILSAKKDTSYVKPIFSKDGGRILFIAFPKEKKNSNIFIYDLTSKIVKQITFQDQLITEAVFSEDDRQIYYLKANSYNSYSPIGRKAPHEFDIYRISPGAKEEKITNLQAYSISNLSEILNKYFLVRLVKGPQVGNFLIKIDESSEIRNVSPKNNPRGSHDMYFDYSYSARFHFFAFTAPYELYSMDEKNMMAKLIYRPNNNELSHMKNIRIFNTQEKIMFLKDSDKHSFYLINFDGTGLRRIAIRR